LDGNLHNSTGAVVYVNLLSGSFTGTVVSSTAPVFMPDNFVGTTNFVFASTVSLTPGTTYYFQPVVQSGDKWALLDDQYGYAGGAFYFNGALDPSDNDAWFREGIIVPEPSSIALLTMFGTGLLLAKRRHSNGKR